MYDPPESAFFWSSQSGYLLHRTVSDLRAKVACFRASEYLISSKACLAFLTHLTNYPKA